MKNSLAYRSRSLPYPLLQESSGAVTAKKRYLTWLLLIIVALTGAWVVNSRLTIAGSLHRNYKSESEDSDFIPLKGSSSNSNSQADTIAVLESTKLSNANTSTEFFQNGTLDSDAQAATLSTLLSQSAESSASQIKLANPEANDRGSYRIFNVTDFTFLHNNATACQGESLIVVVHSAVANVKRRDVIRNTWGKKFPVFFMLGHGAPPVNNSAVDEENNRYNDIVQGSFIDTYRNLTYKHVMALQWALDFCPNASTIVKVDDDVYVNLELLRKYVENLELANKSSAGRNCSNSLMLCDVLNNNPVLRYDGAKWKVTKEEYQPDTYPPYCFGWGVIYCRAAAICLLEQVSRVPFLWVDDAYVTGLLAEAAKVKPTQIERAKLGPGVNDFKEKLDFSRLEYFAKNTIIGPCNLAVEDMDYLSRAASLFKCSG